MPYRVEELAGAAGVGVDTVRYYQREGLLAPPQRDGRVARYDDGHLERLREIRDLARRGFSLAQIRELDDERPDDRLAALAGRNAPDPGLDRAELAERTGVSDFVIGLVVGAGLITPVSTGAGERFTDDAVEMLNAARTLLGEGVGLEELTALAMRHATHVEALVDDTIDLFHRHHERDGRDRGELADTLDRLTPIATTLVSRHFERTLTTRALQRLSVTPRGADEVVVVAHRLTGCGPHALAAFVGSGHDDRFVWVRAEAGSAIAALGRIESIEPVGDDRFSEASAARAAMSARIRRVGAADAPAPILVGGFRFDPGADPRPPAWSGFGDCRFVLAETTVIENPQGAWLLAAGRRTAEDDRDVEDDLRTRAIALAAAIEARAASLGTERTPVRGDDLVDQSPEPDGADGHYREMVAAAVDAIESGELDKVVLARRHLLAGEVDLETALPRLIDTYPGCAVFATTTGTTVFFGATPEELVVLDGEALHTTALAGTAPRSADPERDAELGAELLASAKNRHEHQLVVAAITDKLEGLGLVDPTPSQPDLLRLARVQHLRTPISARVRRRRHGPSDMDVLRVAGVLHPTPAVGGTPDAEAIRFIGDHEEIDRGWYAAPIGWCDLDGNGELRVALRSALADDDGVHLFAGAGIVADSDPDDELAETAVKLRAVLDVLS